jgi:hypothetical protein
MKPILNLWPSWLASFLLLTSACFLALSFDNSMPPQEMRWTLRTDFSLPTSVRVYEGNARLTSGAAVRAWYVDIDYADSKLALRPFLSGVSSDKEPLSELAARPDVMIAVNGGYFDMDSELARTLSPVVSSGLMLASGIQRINRFGQAFHVGRSAFGIRVNRTCDIAWVWEKDSTLYELDQPLPNRPYRPAPVPPLHEIATLPRWAMRDAIGGRPILLRDGKVRVTFDEEVFFGSGFRGDVPYARTAVGITPFNHIILMVVERFPLRSVGLTLHDTALELRKLGCTQAMNLDGGGSTTLVVQGKRLNVPMNGRERPVTSMLALVANDGQHQEIRDSGNHSR